MRRLKDGEFISIERPSVVQRFDPSKLKGTPRLCPGCRSLDGEHDFGPTCTLQDHTCICPDDCGVGCKGQCGCRYCHSAYQDFLSCE